MVDITKNEAGALKMCLNYKDRSTQLSDNYSNAGAQEFAALFDNNMQAAGGLIASLTAKGLGWQDENDDVFWLTELGVNTIFDHIDSK